MNTLDRRQQGGSLAEALDLTTFGMNFSFNH